MQPLLIDIVGRRIGWGDRLCEAGVRAYGRPPRTDGRIRSARIDRADASAHVVYTGRLGDCDFGESEAYDDRVTARPRCHSNPDVDAGPNS